MLQIVLEVKAMDQLGILQIEDYCQDCPFEKFNVPGHVSELLPLKRPVRLSRVPNVQFAIPPLPGETPRSPKLLVGILSPSQV